MDKNYNFKLFRKNISYNFFKSISSGLLVFLITNTIGIFVTPFILNHLTKSEYGFYILCVDLGAWMAFLQFGTSKTLGPLVSMNLKDSKKINLFFNSAFWFQLITSIIAVPLVYLLINYSMSAETSVINKNLYTLIFSFSVFFTIMLSIFKEMIISSKKIYINNYSQIAIQLLKTILIIVFLPKSSIHGLFIIYLTLSIFQLVYYFIIMKTQFSKIKINLKYFSSKIFKIMTNNGLFFTASAFGSIMIFKYDKVFLSKNIGFEFIAKLFVSIKLYMLGEKIVSIIFNTTRPYISEYYGSNDFVKTRDINEIMHYSLYFLSSLVFWFIIIINESFVKLWVGDEYFIGHEISILFGMFYYFHTLTIGNRIILVSTLSYIKFTNITFLILGILRAIYLEFFVSINDIHLVAFSNIFIVIIFGSFIQFALVIRVLKQGFNNLSANINWISTILAPLILLLSFKSEYIFLNNYLFPLVIMIVIISGYNSSIHIKINNYIKSL